MQRAIAMVGLTLMTGGVLGVTATAASAAPTEEKATQSVERHRDHRDGDRDRWRHRDRRYLQGIYPSERICRIVGWSGDRNDRWEDPRCVQVGRRAWALWVEPDNDRRWRGRH
jgi:hypothetical protein